MAIEFVLTQGTGTFAGARFLWFANMELSTVSIAYMLTKTP